MPDRVFLLAIMAGAAVLAAVVVLPGGLALRTRGPGWLAGGEALGLGLAFFLGSVAVSRWPRWSPPEAQDRLLAVLGAVVLVEIVAAWRAAPRWLVWTLRLAVAAAVAPMLLSGTLYLADAAGPGTRLWTPTQTVLWLGGLAGALAVVWALLALLARRASSRSLPLSLAVVSVGAAFSLMFSGYATGGPLLVPLAGALVGMAAVSLAWTLPRADSAAVGVSVVMLFGLLVMGRFLAGLQILYAALLFFAPLLAWLPEVLGKRLPAWLRALMRFGLVAITVAVIVLFLVLIPVPGREAAPAQPGEPSLEDYQQFRP
jgi:hypothetical protein